MFTEERYEGCRLLLEEDWQSSYNFLGLAASPRGPLILCQPRPTDFGSIISGRSALSDRQLVGIVCGAFCRAFDYTDNITWGLSGPNQIYEHIRGFLVNAFPAGIILQAVHRAAIPDMVNSEVLKCVREYQQM